MKSNNFSDSKRYKRFKSNKISFISLLFIIGLLIISVLGYLISPDSTPFANEQCLQITTQKPGFKVQMIYITKNTPYQSVSFFEKIIFGASLPFSKLPINKYYFEDDKIIVEEFSANEEKGNTYEYSIADVAFALNNEFPITHTKDLIVFKDIHGNIHEKKISDLQKQIIENNIKSEYFILGTDKYGRDMLSQLIIGTRVSLSVGLISVIISVVIGFIIGALAGFFRGWIDDLLMWFINVIWSIPTLLLVIAISFALGKGFWQIFIAVGLTMWVEVARVVRGQFISLREKEFVEAARALGYSNNRIIFKHILPNTVGPVIVIGMSNLSTAILLEAGLSFLGLGVQPPTPSWGTMIKEHYGYIILDSAYLAILPGIAIMLTVLAFMLLGNGLRDAFDVKSQIKS